ncbi:hypothetical protein N0V90_003184 [Kalmusia sp. IMI 367209]|nr:hypothetical protein N0V90_003184 [Kalmusia sp. IMI 367209]
MKHLFIDLSAPGPQTEAHTESRLFLEAIPSMRATTDVEQDVQLLQLINPDVTVPTRYDDQNAFMSLLTNLKKAMLEEGMNDKVVYLHPNDHFEFKCAAGHKEDAGIAVMGTL